MKMRDNKKGLSPVIATILLIFLVITIAGIIFLWALGFFTEQIVKNGESADNVCEKISMQIDLAEPYGGGGLLRLDIVNNGNIEIYGISIREAKGPLAASKFYLMLLGQGEAKREEIQLAVGGDLDEVIVYPVILGSVAGGTTNKEYTCINHPIRREI